MGAPRILAPTTISGGIPTAGAGTLNTVALWTPDGFTLGNSLLTQAGSVITNATGAIRANGTTQTTPAFMRYDATNSGIYFPAANEIGFTISGQHAMFISSGRLVGIGTTNPGAKLHVVGNTWITSGNLFTDTIVPYSGGATPLAIASLIYARVDTNTVGIGTASPGAQFQVERAGGLTANAEYIRLRNTTVASGSNVSQSFFVNGNTVATGNISHTWNGTTYDTIFNAWNGSALAEAGRAVGGTTPVLSVPSGLKLPATPGNADTQTLDCYAEGTWTPTVTGFGGTAPTVTGRYTRVGRLVTLSVLVSATGGAQFSSTATTTYISLPSGMTPTTASQPGATSNSGIAADGPCVAYTNGNLYLPTFALRTADTFLTVTYMI